MQVSNLALPFWTDKQTEIMKKSYEFCTEFQKLYDLWATPPSISDCIKIDKKIRKEIKEKRWKDLDILYNYNASSKQESLINWANFSK